MSTKAQAEADPAEEEFAAGWDEAEGSGEEKKAAKPGDGADESTKTEEDEAAAKKAAEDEAAAQSAAEEAKKTKEGDGSATSPKPEDEKDQVGKEPSALEQRLEAIERKSAKSDQDHRAETGRVRKALDEANATITALKKGSAPATDGTDTGVAPGKVKAAFDKIRQTDPELADEYEVIYNSQQDKIATLEAAFDKQVQTQETQSQTQAKVADEARLDAVLPGVPWRDYVEIKDGVMQHAEFSKFLAGQPHAKVAEFWATEDQTAIADVFRSFESAGKETPPSGDAGVKQPETDDKAKETRKADLKRKLQTEASAGIPGGKASTAEASKDDKDDFDTGWDRSERELQIDNAKLDAMRKQRGNGGIAPRL